MRQRMGPRVLRKINELTGQQYVSCLQRGGGDWRWVTCFRGPLPSSNWDWVNRVTGEVQVGNRSDVADANA